MAALTGQSASATYKDLIQVSNSNAGVDATLRRVSDGEGTDSALLLSTTTVGVRQSGGTVDLDELQISHDGTNALFVNKTDVGQFRFGSDTGITGGGGGGGGVSTIRTRRIELVASFAAGAMTVRMLDDTPLILYGSAVPVVWSASSNIAGGTSGDTGLARDGVGVLKVTDGSTGNGWVQSAGRKYKTANQTVTDSTTLTADTHLSVSLLASRKYAFRIVYYATTVATSGIKVDLAGGSATATSFVAHIKIIGNTTDTILAAAETTALNTSLGFTTVGDTSVKVEIDGFILVNAAGTFVPQFAQNAETGAAESVVAKLGSHMIVLDMP